MAGVGAGVSVMAVASLLSAIVTVTSIDSVSSEEREGATEIVMNETEFEPESIQVAAGETVRLVIENHDPYVHTFTIEDLDIDVDFGPGDDKIVEFTVPESGDVAFICDIEGHDDMEGVLEVSGQAAPASP